MQSLSISSPRDFLSTFANLPPEKEASAPPEARGLARDEVRLMVSQARGEKIYHSDFFCLPTFLRPGDLLVVNASGTRNSALEVASSHGKPFRLHLSQPLGKGQWVIEIRQYQADSLPSTPGAWKNLSSAPYFEASPGEVYHLPQGGQLQILSPYQEESSKHRLWRAQIEFPLGVSPSAYLNRWASPIRYDYVKKSWPSPYYQTLFSSQLGSAEMPSAGRPFSLSVLEKLNQRGVGLASLLLHTGVSSQEEGEKPYKEYFSLPLSTAQRVNQTRREGGRIIAVGTTVVRALESSLNERGEVEKSRGWTDLVIGPERGIEIVDGLVTGFHEPRSTHLMMLEALAGRDHLEKTYQAAWQRDYLWHEFGDIHLLWRDF